MKRARVERFILVGAALLPLVLLINAVISYSDVRRLVQSESDVTHTYRVVNALQEVMALVQDAETGHRGYILTGVEAFLEPYWEAVPRLDRAFARLDSLLVDDPAQAARSVQLRSHAEERLEYLAYTLNLFESGGLPAARDVIILGAGRRAMDAVRATKVEMREAETEALQARLARAGDSAQRTIVTQAFSTLIAVVLLVMVLVMFRRLLAARLAAHEALKLRSDRLEDEVLERTKALATANDELLSEIAVRRRAELRLRATVTELERSNRELEDFAFIASHDLQEPLRKIQLFTDRIERRHAGALEETGAADLRRVRAAATRMRRLVNDLLAYARIGRDSRAPTQVNLTSVVSSALEDLSEKIDETGATVAVEGLPTLEADGTQMYQLFHNLLSNALKFRQPGEAPYIRVAGQVLEDRALIEVSDNGIGFDQKYADRIFDPFERLERHGQYEGTGIGLAVCRRVAEYHGGSIAARSAPGEGATFIVTLPLHARNDQLLLPEGAALADHPHGG
jgi:signal transduction histidine kinase